MNPTTIRSILNGASRISVSKAARVLRSRAAGFRSAWVNQLRSVFAFAVFLAVSSTLAQASPIVDMYLLASKTPTGTYSSNISGVAVNDVLYYEVAFKFINNGTAAAPIYPTNTNLPSPITRMSASDFTGGQGLGAEDLGHSGLISAAYNIIQLTGDQIQTTFTTISHGGSSNTLTSGFVTFNKFNGPGAAGFTAPDNPVGPFDYPDGAAINVPFDDGAYAYDGTSQAGTLSGNTRKNIGVITPSGVAASGTVGIIAANTPVLSPLNVGTFKITGITGAGTPSYINLSGAFMTAMTFRYNGNYDDGTMIGSNVGLLGVSVQTAWQAGPDPVITYHPLIIGNAASPTTSHYHLETSVSATSIMKGDTTSVIASVVNDGGPTEDYVVVGPSGFSASSSAVGQVNGGGAFPNASVVPGATLSSPASPTAGSLSFLGLSYGTATISSQVTVTGAYTTAVHNAASDTTVSVNVGVMTPGTTGGGTNSQLVQFNGLSLTSSTLVVNTTYGNGAHTSKFGTHTDGSGANAVPGGFSNATSAELLDGKAGSYTGGNNTGGGSHAAGARVIRMAWRTRADSELPTAPSVAGIQGGVYSDVVQLSGLDGSVGVPVATAHVRTDVFVLQMSVSDAAFSGGHAALETAVSQGLLYLGWLNDTTGTPMWTRAVNGNFTNTTTLANPGNAKEWIGSYASYANGTTNFAGVANKKNAGVFEVGAWGVEVIADPDGDGPLLGGANVWAVLDHNSIFAAAPEPRTFLLGSLGFVGLIFTRWLRRRELAA